VVPPLACRRFEYVVPLVPEGRVDVVKARGTGATTSERVTGWLCAGVEESTTLKVKLVVLLAVGVPAMIPVVVARLSPLGRVPLVVDHA
jgi:hypothetical protein